LEWFRQQGHTITEPSAAGIAYASFLEELSEKEPPAFTTHFYNFYFGHSAGGVIIGKKVHPFFYEKITSFNVTYETSNIGIFFITMKHSEIW
jgi:heme oxygenase